MLQEPDISPQQLWETFKHKRTSIDLYTQDATVLFVPTLVGARGNAEIRKFFLHPHFSDKSNPVKETVFNTLMSNDRLMEESIWSVHFHTGECSWLVPGIEARYLLNATVKFPVSTSATFVNNKIQSIRYHWDQASILKQLKVITEKLQWPVVGEQQVDALYSINTAPLKHLHEQQKPNTPSPSHSISNQPLRGSIFGPVDPGDQVTRSVRASESNAPPARNIFTYQPPAERSSVMSYPNKLGSSFSLSHDEGVNNKQSVDQQRNNPQHPVGVAGKPTPRVTHNIIG
ncbi:hypothetical protein RMATCC62417_08609 [Rhizopus microsporus]|nr:hypothetical protein RMATCC62417_08609 [Rhizopus microsporus]